MENFSREHTVCPLSGIKKRPLVGGYLYTSAIVFPIGATAGVLYREVVRWSEVPLYANICYVHVRYDKFRMPVYLILSWDVHTIIAVNFDLAKHICTRLGGLWNSKKHTDVTLLVGVNRVPVHRVILASQSSYFDRLFFGDNVCEEQQKEINIDDVDNFNVFKLLLEYAYSGCMVIQDMNIQVC